MDKLGYLQHFDYSQLPNVKKNLLPALRNPAADPKRAFTVPWQSGMTGLIVRTDLAPGVDEIADMFDPKYKGKVTMLTEMRDTVPMTLKSMGIDPDTASQDQWLSAVDKVAEAADSGQIRRFTGNDYIKDLPKGDAWIALGWSGDAVQLQKESPNIKFIMPKEGCMLWSTSMEIPVGAPNPQAAQAFINFVYDPEGAGRHRGVGQLRDSGHRREGDPQEARPCAREKPADLPERGVHGELQLRAGARRCARPGGHRGIPARDRVVGAAAVDCRAPDLAGRPRSSRDAAVARRAGRGRARRGAERAAGDVPRAPSAGPAGPARAARPACSTWPWRCRARSRLSSARSPAHTGSGWCPARSTSAARPAGCTTPASCSLPLGSSWRATARCSRGSRTSPAPRATRS